MFFRAIAASIIHLIYDQSWQIGIYIYPSLPASTNNVSDIISIYITCVLRAEFG